MRKAMLVIAAVMLSALASGCNSLNSTNNQPTDPFVGTWKMNPAKSQSSGQLAKSYTVTAIDKGLVQVWVDADGMTVRCGWAGDYDGRDYPYAGNPDKDTFAATRTNPNAIAYVFKKRGREVGSGLIVISLDGKTLVDTGSDSSGTYSLVMEKQ